MYYIRTSASVSFETYPIFNKWNMNSVNSVNSEKLINHWSLGWAQIKDPVSHMCLADTVVASWCLTEEVAGWQVWAILLQWQIFLPLNSLKTFREDSIDLFYCCGIINKLLWAKCFELMGSTYFQVRSNPKEAKYTNERNENKHIQEVSRGNCF